MIFNTTTFQGFFTYKSSGQIIQQSLCIFYFGSHAMSPLSTYTVKMLVTQLCPALCDPMDCSSPGCSVHGILQARILEWVAIPFSGDFLPKGPNPGLLHCGQILYLLSHHQGPYIYSEVLLYSGSQSFSTFCLILLFFRIFSLFCLIEGLPSLPGR